MALSLFVKGPGGSIDAEAEIVGPSDLVTARNVWIADSVAYPLTLTDSMRMVLEWYWDQWSTPLTPVYGLRADGIGGFIGLLSIKLLSRNSLNLPCVSIDYIAKSPLSKHKGITGVSTALIAAVIGRSVDAGYKGRARIPEAMGQNPFEIDEHPAALYAHLGFKSLGKQMATHGVQWLEEMEITSERADILLGRFQK